MKAHKIVTMAVLAVLALSTVGSMGLGDVDKKNGGTLGLPTQQITQSGARLIDVDFENGVDGDPIHGSPWSISDNGTVDAWFNYTDVAGDLVGEFYDHGADPLRVSYSMTGSMQAAGSWIEIGIGVVSVSAGAELGANLTLEGDTAIEMRIDDTNVTIVASNGYITWEYAASALTILRFIVVDDTSMAIAVNGTLNDNGGAYFDTYTSQLLSEGIGGMSFECSLANGEANIYIWYIDVESTGLGAIDEDFEGYVDGAHIGPVLGEEANNTFGQGYWVRSNSYPFAVVDEGANNVGYINDIGTASCIIDYYNGTGTAGAGTMVEAITMPGDYFAVKVTPRAQSMGASLQLRLYDDVNGLASIMTFSQMFDSLMFTDGSVSHFHDIIYYATYTEYEIRFIIVSDITFDLWINGILYDNAGLHYEVENGMTTHVADVQFKTGSTPTSTYYIDDLDFSTTGDRVSVPLIFTDNTDFPLYAERGNGTLDNPWVISDLSIDVAGGNSGIAITTTNEHVLFKNIWIVDALVAAIDITTVSNVHFDDVYVCDSMIGIKGVTVAGLYIDDLYIMDTDSEDAYNTTGMYLDSIAGAYIDDVVVSGDFAFGMIIADGIGMGSADDISVSDLDINGDGTTSLAGVYMFNTPVVAIEFNTVDIEGVRIGIELNAADVTPGDPDIYFDGVFVHDLWGAEKGLFIETTSFVTFTNSIIEVNGAGDMIVDADTGPNWNLTFLSVEFSAMSAQELLSFTSGGNFTFLGCTFDGYSKELVDFIMFDTVENVTFFANTFASGLNDTCFTVITSLNITAEYNLFGDYFDVFPYANATDMSMTTLNETYSLDGEINDTTPYYTSPWFVRDVNVTFSFEDVDHNPISALEIFSTMSMDVNGDAVITATTNIDQVLYGVTIMSGADCVFAWVFNLNSTGPDVLITLNVTVAPVPSYVFDVYADDFTINIEFYADNISMARIYFGVTLIATVDDGETFLRTRTGVDGHTYTATALIYHTNGTLYATVIRTITIDVEDDGGGSGTGGGDDNGPAPFATLTGTESILTGIITVGAVVGMVIVFRLVKGKRKKKNVSGHHRKH